MDWSSISRIPVKPTGGFVRIIWQDSIERLDEPTDRWLRLFEGILHEVYQGDASLTVFNQQMGGLGSS